MMALTKKQSLYNILHAGNFTLTLNESGYDLIFADSNQQNI